MDDLTDILQRLHDSEINASLSWFYDEGFKWELGDNINGWTTDGRALTARQAIYELAEHAFAEFQRSAFAEWWKEARRVKSAGA